MFLIRMRAFLRTHTHTHTHTNARALVALRFKKECRGSMKFCESGRGTVA